MAPAIFGSAKSPARPQPSHTSQLHNSSAPRRLLLSELQRSPSRAPPPRQGPLKLQLPVLLLEPSLQVLRHLLPLHNSKRSLRQLPSSTSALLRPWALGSFSLAEAITAQGSRCTKCLTKKTLCQWSGHRRVAACWQTQSR
jgi:hypothetical protein